MDDGAVRPVVLVVAVGLFAGGCGGDARHQTLEGTAFAVSVAADAQSAAGASGVDLRRLVTASANKALALLPHRGRVEITVRVSPERTIPGIGIGGFTGPKGNVAIAIDPSHTDLRHTLETWIPATVAHELHHSSRMRVGPGYGVTLGQAIVSEGLADRFAYEVFPDTPPQPWDHALTKAQEQASWLSSAHEHVPTRTTRRCYAATLRRAADSTASHRPRCNQGGFAAHEARGKSPARVAGLIAA
jgi:hypothetical protein